MDTTDPDSRAFAAFAIAKTIQGQKKTADSSNDSTTQHNRIGSNRKFGAQEDGANWGRSVARVYTSFINSFKDFIFPEKLLLLALIAHRVHRKR